LARLRLAPQTVNFDSLRRLGFPCSGAFAFTIGYDKVTSAWWDNHNKGKQWKE